LGDECEAAVLSDFGIAIYRRLAQRQAQAEQARRQATDSLSKARATEEPGNSPGMAPVLRDVCHALFGVAMPGLGGVVGTFVGATAGALLDPVIASRQRRLYFEGASAPLERMVLEEGHVELAGDLARAYKIRALERLGRGDGQAAVTLFNQAL